MDKPDLKVIGLNLAEDTIKSVIKQVVKPYAAWYVTQSENKVDDIILPFLDQLEAALLGLADKIDGQVG